ncbi:MAG: carboxypeptidase regulatory-like domain-containing protein [bacterium]|nr:carboxypeptidase regulatory-like domain-containing protein [bacterium]
MKIISLRNTWHYMIIVLAAALMTSLLFVSKTSAACTLPATHYGIATISTSVPAAGDYRVWVRMMAPDSTNNSVLLEIDGGTCYTVGNSTSIAANTWTWVSYENNNTSSIINANLTAGNHSVRIIGNERGVKVDRVILTADASCIPSNTKDTVGSVGTNCATPPDTTAPVISITSPADNSTHSGLINITADATDDTGGSGIARVELYAGTRLINTDTTTPYSISVESSTLTAGLNTLLMRAYDVAGNTSSDSVVVNVQTGTVQDTVAPSTPTSLRADADAHNRVTFTWSASTDNVGVAGYYVYRDGVALGEVGSGTTYVDNTVVANTTYSYKTIAFDAAGNNSGFSEYVPVTTPAAPDTTPPTRPASLTASLVGTSQANLTWSTSSDNLGVKEYDVYRATGTQTAVKITTVTTTSFGNTGLSASTTYKYHIVAKDAAGNGSPASPEASVTTPAPTPPSNVGSISGRVTTTNGNIIAGANISLVINNVTNTYTASSTGAYTIYNVPPGTYSVRYSATGYYSRTHSIKVSSGQNTVKSVKLQKV